MTQLGSQSSTAVQLPDTIDGVPNVSGAEGPVAEAMRASEWPPLSGLHHGGDPLAGIGSACAIALHMHQPLIPAGGERPRTAAIISNLQYMMENPGIGDNHNASVFHWCYKRMGEFIPQLVDEGKQPRVMLEYSGTLLHGLRQMGADDVFDNLSASRATRAIAARGMAGLPVGTRGRAVDAGAGLPRCMCCLAAPFRGHLRPGGDGPRAWVLAVGDGAAQPAGHRLRVRAHAQGLRLPVGARAGAHGRAPGRAGPASTSTSRTALSAAMPRGERPASSPSSRRRAATPSWWRRCSPITRPKDSSRWELAGKQVPPLVTQIADGENGGVMMNEFPSEVSRGHARVLRLRAPRP